MSKKFNPDDAQKMKEISNRMATLSILGVIKREAMKGYSGFTVSLKGEEELHGVRKSFLYSEILKNKEKLEKAGYKILKKSGSLTLVWG